MLTVYCIMYCTSVICVLFTDVVPVFPERWKHHPFSAHKDENGDIHGSGTQVTNHHHTILMN